MRVIGGKYRSRVLKSLRGRAMRPTSDRLRETLFNILGASVEDSIFVDLYAGTGAIGIEALSRGAAEVIFIEKHAPAANLIRKNLESLGVQSGAVILAMDAVRGLDQITHRRFGDRLQADYIFLDPPYAAREEYLRALEYLDESKLLAPSGLIVVEHRRDTPLPKRLTQIEQVRVVEQGDAALSFYRLARAA